MREKNIIKRFLDAGLQVGKDALDYFKDNEGDIGVFIERFSRLEEKPNIITTKTIQKLLKDQHISTKTDSLLSERKAVSISGLVKLMTEKYNLIKGILEEKKELKNLLSINKISPNMKGFSIICMAKSLENKTIVVEDTTGDLTLDTSGVNDIILQDDVLGLLCEQKEGTVLVKEVVWPGIPLKRDIKRLEKEMGCVFVGSEVREIYINGNNKMVFVVGPQRELKCTSPCERTIFLSEDSKSKEKSVHTLPVITTLNGTNIVVLSAEIIQKYEKHWKSPIEVVKNLLKRRDIDPIQEIARNYTISSVLKEPPDIIAFPNGEENVLNYKGTTIIPIPTDGGYYIDLSTREVKKI